MKPMVHANKTLHTLLALLALALLLPQTTQAQEIWEIQAAFSMQDGRQTIAVEGLFEIAYNDSILTVDDGEPSPDGVDTDADGYQPAQTTPSVEVTLTVTDTQTGQVREKWIDILSVNWGATTETGRFNFAEGSPISRCETGTLKEASFEIKGLPFSVQLCSTEDGPLTVTPGRIEVRSAKGGYFFDDFESFRTLEPPPSSTNEELQMSISMSSR